MTLRADHGEQFAKLRILPVVIEAARVESKTDFEIRELFAINGQYRGRDLSGILFPYLSPIDGRRVGGRHRLDHPLEDQKYISEIGNRHLYFGPGSGELLTNTEVPVAIVEAEKAVLAVLSFVRRIDRLMLALATGGCWAWRRTVGNKPLPDGGNEPEKGPSPDFDLVAWRGRPVIIIADSNVNTNKDVKVARLALAKELTSRGAEVFLVAVPAGDGCNGPDDFLAVHSDEEMERLLESAKPALAVDPHEPTLPVFSEEALALQFSAKHADDLRYVAGWGKWLRWDAARWREDNTLQVFDLARKLCRDAAVECKATEPKAAQRVAAAATVAAVERLSRADRRHAATVEQWDSDPWSLNTPKGTIDLRAGDQREHSREDYLTKLAGSYLAGDSSPVLWLQFLERVTNEDVELQAFLQRVIGYCLTGSIREHALFFLWGTGANGKSVFVSTISAVLGDYAKTAPISTFLATGNEQHPTDLAGLRGARLVTAIETEDGRRWAESKIKSLTGGDKIAARFMRQDFFEFAPHFKLIIAGNHKPGLRSVDEAIRRRLHLIPFVVTIPAKERDPQLTEKLKAEYPAILRWAIDGCLDWEHGGLNPPAAVLDATAEYLSAEDRIGQWLEERCDVGRSFSAKAGDLYRSWKLWCESAGERPGSQKRFSQNLQDRGYRCRHERTGNWFGGVAPRVPL